MFSLSPQSVQADAYSALQPPAGALRAWRQQPDGSAGHQVLFIYLCREKNCFILFAKIQNYKDFFYCGGKVKQ